MFWRVVGSIFAVIWIVNAFQMLGCNAIEFSGGRRLVVWTCAQSGIPGPLAGLAIIGIGAVLLWIWWSPYVSPVKPNIEVQIADRQDSTTDDLRRHNTTHTQEPAKKISDASYEGMAGSGRGITRFDVASNPEAPVEVLATLSRDTWYPVRVAVAKNEATPLAVLEELRSDRNQEVASAAVLAMESRLCADEGVPSVSDAGQRAEPKYQEGSDQPTEATTDDTGDPARGRAISAPIGLEQGASRQGVSALLDGLERLTALTERGYLTADEFELLKQRLLKGRS